ncbi:MAG: TonB-dependent receptor family protein [Nannocystales bacterium]
MLAILAVGVFSSTSQAGEHEPVPENDAVDVDLSDFDPDADDRDADGASPEAPDDPADSNATNTPDRPDAATSPADAEDEDNEFDAATPTVSIIGEPEEQPRIVGSAHSVDEETLEREEHDDIHRVLRSVPGVYVRGEDGYGLRPNIGLRGADPNRSSKVTLMEDGILFGPAPYSAPAAYYFPMTTRLVGVEVFKGPATVRFGPNTIGGAVNLQTREIPQDLETGVDIAAGTWGYGKLHGFAGKSWKRFGVLFEGARVRASGFKDLDGGGDTGFRKNEFMLKARLHGDPGARVYQQFDVKFGLSTEVSNETYLGLTQEDFDDSPYRRYRASALDRMDWWRTQAQAAYFMATGIVEYQSTLYRHDFSRAWTKFNRFAGTTAPDPYSFFQDPSAGANGILLSVLRGESDSTSAEENLLIGTNQRDFVSQGWQNTLRISPNTRYVDQVIEVGARLHFDRVSRIEDEDQYAMLSGSPVLVTGTQQLVAQNRGEALAGSFHVADEIRIVDRFTLSPGARVEVIRTEFQDTAPDPAVDPETITSVDTVFLPGVGLHVQATPWLGVLGGVHSGFSPKAPGRGASVQAERSINYEAGLRATHKGFRAEGIAFANDYSNLVSNCTFSQGCDSAEVGAQFSGGEVLIAGAESLAGYRTDLGGAGWIDTTATYTYTWTRFSNTFSSSSPFLGEVERGDKVPYVPEHVASLQFAGGMRRWGGHAQLHFNGQMRDVPGQGAIPSQERIDRFVTLDLGGNVFITRRAQIYLNLGNATRASYAVSRRPFGLRPGQRFSLIAGFKHNFR